MSTRGPGDHPTVRRLDYNAVIASMTERDWSRIWGYIEVGDCWHWTGPRESLGYGQVRIGGRAGPLVIVHRLIWTHLVGTVPVGLDLDHRCRNRLCANTDHLEPVSHRENILRGRAGAHFRQHTHCPHGHEYTKSNTYRRPGRAARNCRTCRSLQRRAA